MDDKFWDIFNRNMKEGIHHTNGKTRSRDVREVIYWLRERDLWWKDGRLLNIGIGDGEEAFIFVEEGLEVTGISNSLEEVKNIHATRDHMGLYVTAFRMDAHQMSFQDESFDYVYLHDTMEHFIAPIMVFAQLRRVLRMGGILAFHYPTISDSHNWTHWFIESPRLIFDWLLKFGFRLLCFKYEPMASSEQLYIAQKVEITEDEYQRGGNIIGDILREMKQLKEDGS